ncbi:MAG: hypothetical protein JO270_14830 [Acidobacteriaceae bacterium]|nr:hypothetical protein [Acidobacteriaceae bacterium]
MGRSDGKFTSVFFNAIQDHMNMEQENEHAGEAPQTDANRSAGDNIKDLTQASKQIFEAGQQLVTNLNELQQRVKHATDWRSQLSEKPWLIAVGALVAGVAGWRFFSRKG